MYKNTINDLLRNGLDNLTAICARPGDGRMSFAIHCANTLCEKKPIGAPNRKIRTPAFLCCDKSDKGFRYAFDEKRCVATATQHKRRGLPVMYSSHFPLLKCKQKDAIMKGVRRRMDAMKELLKRLSAEFQKSTYPYAEKTPFNIFRVLGIQTKEVMICRFLGEMLDPNGSHALGAFPLAQFFEVVLNENAPADVRKARVELEEKIDEERRVDIAIHICNKVVPIEVKVWAGDQDAQLSDYYTYYARQNTIDKIYYLTPYGWSPSQRSAGQLDDNQIRCLSFQSDIKTWLETIENENMPDGVRIAIHQFKEIIADMCAKNHQLESAMRVLNLDSDIAFNVNNDALRAAVALLNLKDDLTPKIIVNYLSKQIAIPDGYALEEDEEKDVDRHSFLKVMKGDTAVAWICVETNLYIVAKRVKTATVGDLWKEIHENYAWQYLHPAGNGKKFPLKNLKCMFDDDRKIEIKEFLEDLVLSDAVSV